MGSADDDFPIAGAPAGRRGSRQPRSPAEPPPPPPQPLQLRGRQSPQRQPLLPERMAASRGAWLAAATAFLTAATVLSITLGAGGTGGAVRGRAESVWADVWGHAGHAPNATNGTKWRTSVLASVSQWHGTSGGASAVLLNATEDVQAADNTVSVVEKIELDPKRARTKHRNPADKSWQQFTVTKPAGVETESFWNGSLIVQQAEQRGRLPDQIPVDLLEPIAWDIVPFHGGITEEMIEQMYCGLGEASLRIQIINNLAYVVGESKSRFQRRHHRIKLQVQEFLEKHKGDWLPWGSDPPHGFRNADLVFWTGDDFPPDERDKDNDNKGPCNVTWGPIVSAGRRLKGNEFVALVPDDYLLTGIYEAAIAKWEEIQPKLWEKKKEAPPWQDRRPEIQFRGARSTEARLTLFENTRLLESPLTDFSFTDASLDNFRMFVSEEDGFLRPDQQCDTRYILHMEGRLTTGSIRYALACGAVVLWPRDPENSREEFIHRMLRDGVQLVVLDPVTPENRGDHVLEAVEQLEAAAKESNSTLRIAMRAGAFTDNRLAGVGPFSEWRTQAPRKLAEQIAMFQRFQLKEPHADAVPLADSIARGETFDGLPDLAEARNCSICKPFGWGDPAEAAKRWAEVDAAQEKLKERRRRVGETAGPLLAERRAQRREKAAQEKAAAEEKERKEKEAQQEREAAQKKAEEDKVKADKEREEKALQEAKEKEEKEKAEKEEKERAEKAEKEEKERADQAESREAERKLQGEDAAVEGAASDGKQTAGQAAAADAKAPGAPAERAAAKGVEPAKGAAQPEQPAKQPRKQAKKQPAKQGQRQTQKQPANKQSAAEEAAALKRKQRRKDRQAEARRRVRLRRFLRRLAMQQTLD